MHRSQKALRKNPQMRQSKSNSKKEQPSPALTPQAARALKKKQELQLVLLLFMLILTMGVIFVTVSSAIKKATVYQSSEPMPHTITPNPPRGQRK